MKFETKQAAVFFVDILGMSALTEGAINLEGLDEKIGGDIYDIEINGAQGFSSPNQVIAAWTLKTFREVLGTVCTKYNVNISQLSDCAFVWSEDTSELLLASSELMWELTLSGVLCRGGLSYGEVIVPRNDKESFGSFILGDAVTKAAKHEGRGKGCRVFTDEHAAYKFNKHFPGKVSRPFISTEIYNEIFGEITNPLDYSIVDEFKWYLFYDLKGITHESLTLNRAEHAMYMAGLVSTLRHSPYFAWNAQNKHGLVQLAGSIEAISSAIKTHTGHDQAKQPAEYAMQYLSKVTRSYESVKLHFYQYNVDALTKGAHDEMTELVASQVAERLSLV
ncbi:hypothetical protein [Vibrio parahaemolyticus]|uniref:hypothetical protein n=1 Tax=Vibrio parahaemolyticus TaxID=670 RepID=UPI002B1ED641|nr:hypothetical protein [Vibrio parahaemolyticus]MEA5181914.1 hypothetical protein [Vibrio parahaemolyticus]HAV1351146.1 hypothetical protein [Vibrio parahaemolyticus]